MTEGLTSDTPISFEMEPLTSEQIEAFRRATRTEHSPGVPYTFATLMRAAEFEWVDRIPITERAVLHAEQEYEYFSDLRPGDRPRVTTSLKNLKARSGMRFLVLESRIECQGELRVIGNTTFVIRDIREAGK